MSSTQEILSKYSPGGIFGFDRDGRPVYYEPIGRVDFVGLLHSVKSAEFVDYGKQRAEKLKKICKEQEEKLGKNLGTYSTMILDAEGGSRKHLWRPGIDAYTGLIKIYEKEYPDLRERILIINTPVVFPIIFSLLKPFLREETKAKIKVLGSNWKDELLKYVDKENLPEFYGGTCRDNNDDPQCKQYICFGGEVPKSCYTSEKVTWDEFQSTTVNAGKSFTYEVEIQEANQKLVYKFATNDFNIKFGVKAKTSDGKITIVIPSEIKQSHLTIEEGEIECREIGVYKFKFDNRYSWLRSKALFYLVKIESLQS